MTTDKLRTLEDVDVLSNVSLASYTGFRCGGPSTVVVPRSEDAFVQVIGLLREEQKTFFILGNGSNVLVPDEGYSGYVVVTKSALQDLSVNGNFIHAGAGSQLTAVCHVALGASLTGMEFAFGIPGTVGGAVYMNAGAYGSEIKNVLSSVTILDDNCEVRELPADSLDLSYRHSIFHQNKKWIVLSATFELKPGEHDTIHDEMFGFLSRRIEKQPLNYPSCGSTFKRPQGSYASKLIDECGLKGFRIGGAAVSEKHAGFVINLDHATSTDILRLCREVHDRVMKETGFDLQMEVEIMK